MTYEYLIVRANYVSDLEIEVNRRMRLGWTVCGGIAVNPKPVDRYEVEFLQVVTKALE